MAGSPTSLRMWWSPGAPRRLLACLALVCALAHAAAGDPSPDAARERAKRAEMSPVPFVMGSRYGRSPERVMAPRNDRFFMGSRYGKRSGADEGSSELAGVWPGCEGAGAHCRRLLCRYSGVPHLYKCVRTHDMQFVRRNIVDPGSGETDE